MIKTKDLIGRNGSRAAKRAAEPVIETARLDTLEDIQALLARLTEERRALEAERTRTDDRLADLLAVRTLGGRIDTDELIGLTDRRNENQAEADHLDLVIAGLRERAGQMLEAERAQTSARVRSELDTVDRLGDQLTETLVGQLREVSKTLEQIEANRRAFATLSREWDRLSPTVGHGYAEPRDVLGLFAPDIVRRMTTSAHLRETLAACVDDWYTEPARRVAERAAEIADQMRRADEAKAEAERLAERERRQLQALEAQGYAISPR